ncbi:phosphodiester glycosidase family protein [Falsirhodobacter xinxiangensis]|uniref:phosphodiester glycosidase family protein n=1 Tax=Falsirhodobacter xinxiangensis TaxID=2530049 RepID=UPI0010AA566A|nr:phosphodiester glycosidase family protein [Rhodobacter xinxiangensis]
MKTRLLAALLFLVGAPAWAGCREVTFEGQEYTVCEVQAGEDLRIFQNGPEGKPFGAFSAINRNLDGKRLGFAMNAGMYHPDRRPVGLLIVDGVMEKDLVVGESWGNFGMEPNGVFCIGDGFSVIETRAYQADPPECRYATQSGPMLVIDGELHPRFLADSDSRYIRNGVGVSADGRTAYFAISSDDVTFYEFARLFQDHLGTPDALYFDGSISRLHAPEMGRDDIGFPLGPIVGTVVAPEGRDDG